MYPKRNEVDYCLQKTFPTHSYIETSSANMPAQTLPTSPTEAANPSTSTGQQPDIIISKDVFVNSPVHSDSEDSFRHSPSEGNPFINTFVSPCDSGIENEFCLDDFGIDSTSLDNLYAADDSELQGLDLSVGHQDFELSTSGMLDLKLNETVDEWKPSDMFENLNHGTSNNGENKSDVKNEYDESDLLDLNDVDSLHLQFDLEDSIADASMRQTNTFITAPNAQTQRNVPEISDEEAVLNLSMLGSVFPEQEEDRTKPPPLINGYLPFVPGNSQGRISNLTYSTNEMIINQNSQLNLIPPSIHQQDIIERISFTSNELNSLADIFMVPSDKNALKSPARLAPCSTLLPGSKIMTMTPRKQNTISSNRTVHSHDEIITNAMSSSSTESLGGSVFGDGVAYGFVGVNPTVNLTRNGMFNPNEALMIPQQFSSAMVPTTNAINVSSAAPDILSQSCEIIQPDSSVGLGSHACHPNGQECLAWACKACKRKSGPHDR